MDDGTVEIVCEGGQDAIDALIESIRVLAPPIEVRDVQTTYSDAKGLTKFEIIAGDLAQEMVAGFGTGAAYINKMLEKQDKTLDEIRSIGERQDKTLEKQDKTLDEIRSIGERQDKTLEKQDKTLDEIRSIGERQDKTLDEIRSIGERQDKTLDEIRSIGERQDKTLDVIHGLVKNQARMLERQDETTTAVRDLHRRLRA